MKSFRFITSHPYSWSPSGLQPLLFFLYPTSLSSVMWSSHCDEITSTSRSWKISSSYHYKNKLYFWLKKIHKLWIFRIDHFSFFHFSYFGLFFQSGIYRNSVCCSSTGSQRPEVLQTNPSYSGHPSGFLLEQESYSKILSLHSTHRNLYTLASQLRSSSSGVLTCPSLLWGLNMLVMQNRVSFGEISFHLHSHWPFHKRLIVWISPFFNRVLLWIHHHLY